MAYISFLQACAGYGDRELGPCDGDEGAPLVEISTGKLIGLFSWNQGKICILKATRNL